VKEIDKAVGRGAATGAPFVVKSAKNTVKSKDAIGKEVDTEMLTVTVCMAVADNAGQPSKDNVTRDVRANEKVFARACALADAATCIDGLRAALVTRLGPNPLVADVDKLLWRSVPIKTATADAAEMRRVLTSADIRLVTLPPPIETSGDRDLAAVLTAPIEQQKPRPLITKRPSAFDVHALPNTKGVVVAITLTPDLVAALTAPPTPAPQ